MIHNAKYFKRLKITSRRLRTNELGLQKEREQLYALVGTFMLEVGSYIK